MLFLQEEVKSKIEASGVTMQSKEAIQRQIAEVHAEESDEDDKFSEFERYDLFQKDYDRYGSLIPKPFGYDLFQNYERNNLTSVQSAPADYILAPGDELRINFSGSLKASRKVKIDREGNIFLSFGQIFTCFLCFFPPAQCRKYTLL